MGVGGTATLLPKEATILFNRRMESRYMTTLNLDRQCNVKFAFPWREDNYSILAFPLQCQVDDVPTSDDPDEK